MLIASKLLNIHKTVCFTIQLKCIHDLVGVIIVELQINLSKFVYFAKCAKICGENERYSPVDQE